MRRFFCSSQNITSHEIKILDKNELHHLKDVLRLKCKDKVVVLDGEGGEFICQINQIDKSCAKLEIIEEHLYEKSKSGAKISVACALPKKSKIDFIVEKLTEIGVDKIILLKTERTEVKLKDIPQRIERLRKTAESALKQSGNVFLPKIEFLDFPELLKVKANFDLAVIPNLSHDTQNLKDAIGVSTSCRNILVAIGPEGDFSQEEINSAKRAGFVSVSLGKSVLRVDTAAIVAVGFIKLYLSSE